MTSVERHAGAPVVVRRELVGAPERLEAQLTRLHGTGRLARVSPPRRVDDVRLAVNVWIVPVPRPAPEGRWAARRRRLAEGRWTVAVIAIALPTVFLTAMLSVLAGTLLGWLAEHAAGIAGTAAVAVLAVVLLSRVGHWRRGCPGVPGHCRGCGG